MHLFEFGTEETKELIANKISINLIFFQTRTEDNIISENSIYLL